MKVIKMKENYPLYESSCCGVGTSIGGVGETHYYICNRCGEACDFVVHPTIPVKPVTSISKHTSKLMVSHGDTHPFGEKCETCDKIKKEYAEMIKKALPTHKGGVLTRSEVKKILDNL